MAEPRPVLYWWNDHSQRATFMQRSDENGAPSQVLAGLEEFICHYRSQGYEIVNSTPDGRKEVGREGNP